MKKETFYFPHDYEPTSDPKIQALIGKHGSSGYGIYWRIIEMLHSDPDHKLQFKEYLFLAIAKQMLTNAEQIKSIIDYCIVPCELFISDDTCFWSNRVNDNISLRTQLSEKRSNAGKASAEKRKKLTRVEHVLTCVEQIPTKERKEKESKEEEIKEKEMPLGPTNKFPVENLCDYDKYQSLEPTTNKPPTNEQQTDNKPPTTTKEEEKNIKIDAKTPVLPEQPKSRQKKEKKKFIPPMIDEVINYFKEKGYSKESAKTAFDYYNVADWQDSKGNQVLNWKQKMISVWFKPENKTKSNDPVAIR